MTNLRRILMFGSTEPVELLMGVLTIAAGGYLVLPFDSYAAVPEFGPMAHLVPEWAVGVLLCCVGAGSLGALLYDGRRARMLTAGARFWLWLSIATVMFIGAAASPGWVTYTCFAVASAWVYIRLSGDPHGGN